MKKIIIVILSFLFLSSSFSFKTIDLNNYKKIRKILVKNKEKIKNNDSVNKIITYLCKQECSYFYSSDENYYFKPFCFSNFCIGSTDRKFIEFRDSVDTIWPLISGFKNVYNLKSNQFIYTTAKPEFYVNYNLEDFIGTGKIDNVLLGVLQVSNYYIKVPKIFLAFENMKNYSFYVSDKSLELRNKSRLYNFNLAMSKLDGYLLNPGKEIYFNKLIAYLPGYKKKNPKSKLAFYGGVCGVSTMLFRNSLINPYLFVKQRYNHSQRYVNFYDKYIWGDDASVYEFIKRLIIKNIGDMPIYFRKKQIGKKLYFVSIIPKKVEDFVLLKKGQIGKLSAKVSSDTFDKNGFLKYNQSWISNYMRKNYER